MRKLVILGSTGSIGRQALDVVRDSDELEVVGLAAGESWERLLAQATEHGVGAGRARPTPAPRRGRPRRGAGERCSPGPRGSCG